MALHSDLPIHRTGVQLLALAIQVQAQMPAADVHQVANSYFGLLSQATHSHQDRARFANAVRHRGHCITGALTKAFP